MFPQILAWMEGYISTSSMVSVISLSRIMATLDRFLSSGWLQNLHKDHTDELAEHKKFEYTVNTQGEEYTKSFILVLHMLKSYWKNYVTEEYSYLVRLGSHGVMYSRHKCLSSILEARKPCIHSSRNSSVRWGSLAASFSLTLLMKIVLLDGMQSPEQRYAAI